MTLNYDFSTATVAGVPQYFLRYRGEDIEQMVVGLAFGPDGLYFAPLFPNAAGTSAIYKITYDPEQPHPYTMVRNDNPVSLMVNYGCFACHSLNNSGGAQGPVLDRESLIASIEARLASEEYRTTVQSLDEIEAEPYRSFREARQAVLAAEGEEQLQLWATYHIREPKFDNPSAQMPNLGLSEQEAAIIAEFLLQERFVVLEETEAPELSAAEQVGVTLGRLPPSKWRYTVLAFGGGFVLALGVAFLLVRWRRTRQ